MGTVTVTGRDELGRIIDVQMTTEADVPPPGPEVVAASDGAVVQTVLSRTTTLTNAQILALPTTPVELVPAPGAGKFVRWVDASLTIDPSAGAYTFAVGAYWQLCYVTPLAPIEASGFIDLTASALSTQPSLAIFPAFNSYDTNHDGYLYTGWHALADTGTPLYENRALAIVDMYNGVSDYTGGNAANTMTVTVLYTVIDL